MEAPHLVFINHHCRGFRRRLIGFPLLFVVLLNPKMGAAADLEQKLDIGGIARTYALHVPPDASALREMPLLLVLHGALGDAKITAKQTHFNEEADREGFLVAYPEGTDRIRPLLNLLGKRFLTWNAGGCCGYAKQQQVDDVSFLRAVTARIEQDYRIDPRRVYAAGISNGGMMAYRLACEASDVFAAVGVVSAVLVTAPCAPRGPVSVIHFHGTDDQYVPIDGGVGEKSLAGTRFPPVIDSILFWIGVDGCRSAPISSQSPTGVDETTYRDCKACTAVTYYRIEGAGHAWPGGDRISPLLDSPPTSIAATSVMWQFFAAHPKGCNPLLSPALYRSPSSGSLPVK
jgi:polyhydroxybutyrate depolymerase